MTNGGSDTYACKCLLTTLPLPVAYKNPKITIAFSFQKTNITEALVLAIPASFGDWI